jgi:hypothetical protein
MPNENNVFTEGPTKSWKWMISEDEVDEEEEEDE